jgi:hypothetical protein
MKRSLIGLIAGALVFAGGCQLGPRVEFVKGDDKIGVMIGDKHFTNYLYRNELTKPGPSTPCRYLLYLRQGKR